MNWITQLRQAWVGRGTNRTTLAAVRCTPSPPLSDRAPVVMPVLSSLDRFQLVDDYRVPDPSPRPTGHLSLIVRAPDTTAPPSPDFNGASVPKFAWVFMRPMEPRVVPAALVHDVLYAHAGRVACDQGGPGLVVDRTYADWLFYVILVEVGGMRPTRAWIAYLAVHLFGRDLWGDADNPPTAPTPEGLAAEAALREVVVRLLQTHQDTHRRLLVRMGAGLGCGVLLIVLPISAAPTTWLGIFGAIILGLLGAALCALAVPILVLTPLQSRRAKSNPDHSR